MGPFPGVRTRLPKNVRRHGSGYRVVVYRDQHRYPSPTFRTVEKAVLWRDAFLATVTQEPSLPPLTLAHGLRLILDDLEATAARTATVEFYTNHARILFAGLGGEDVTVSTITKAMLSAYIERRRRAGAAATTIVGKELFVLRRIRKLAIAAGYSLPADPFLGLRTPKGRAQRFAYLPADRVLSLIERMRATTKYRKAQWDADVVETMFTTGLRLSEFSRLRVCDIDFAAGTLSVDGKTGHRHQTFGESLAPTLRRLVAAAKPNGQIANKRALERLFPEWQRRLGEPRLSAHVMRHSYATAMAEHVEPFELMVLMDHKDLRQTSRYYHGRGSEIRGALDNLLRHRRQPEPTAHEGAAAPSSEQPSKPRARRGRRARSDR